MTVFRLNVASSLPRSKPGSSVVLLFRLTVDDRINHIPKEMPGRLVPDVQVPEDWFEDIGVVDEGDDVHRVARQSVQRTRDAAVTPANPRVVPEQFEHFQQPASALRLPCDKDRFAGIDLQHRLWTQRH